VRIGAEATAAPERCIDARSAGANKNGAGRFGFLERVVGHRVETRSRHGLIFDRRGVMGREIKILLCREAIPPVPIVEPDGNGNVRRLPIGLNDRPNYCEMQVRSVGIARISRSANWISSQNVLAHFHRASGGKMRVVPQRAVVVQDGYGVRAGPKGGRRAANSIPIDHIDDDARAGGDNGRAFARSKVHGVQAVRSTVARYLPAKSLRNPDTGSVIERQAIKLAGVGYRCRVAKHLFAGSRETEFLARGRRMSLKQDTDGVGRDYAACGTWAVSRHVFCDGQVDSDRYWSRAFVMGNDCVGITTPLVGDCEWIVRSPGLRRHGMRQ
jgi:hypothetical protein